MRYFVLFFGLLFSAATAFAANPRLDGYFDYAIYKDGNGRPYVESYLRIAPGSFNLGVGSAGGTRNGKVEVTYLYYKGSEIVNYDKIVLNTGDISAASASTYSLVTMQRHALEEGSYRLELIMEDMYSDGLNKLEHTDSLNVFFSSNRPQMSYPWLLSSAQTSEPDNIFSKGGVEMVPLEGNVIDNTTPYIPFYMELYGTDSFFKGEKYILSYYLQDATTERIVEESKVMKQMEGAPSVGLINYLITEKIAPEYYYFVIEVQDRENNVLSQAKRLIEITGTEQSITINDLASVGTEWLTYVNNRDSLEEYIRSLAPVSNKAEQAFASSIIKSDDRDNMKRYIVSYWQRKKGADARKAFEEYKIQVAQAQQAFGTPIRRGYQTDRGRVYLQYGAPDVRTERPSEPHAYPYEIWWYYKLPKQTNRKFIFYAPEVSTNDYELLHSDAIGERRTPNWEYMLNSRGKKDANIDNNTYQPNYGSWANDFWTTPR